MKREPAWGVGFVMYIVYFGNNYSIKAAMLESRLLNSEEIGSTLEDSPLKDTIIKGVYSPQQFVLRLRPDIHKELEELEAGIYEEGELSLSQIQAFSTYLHETIHWWQHIGSNFGFFSSLSFPVQAHVTKNDLQELINQNRFHKSILQYNINAAKRTGKEDDEVINKIVNNWFDIQFASLVTFDPNFAKKVKDHNFFESIGHSYYILWSSCIQTLASCVDIDFKFLPDVRKWDKEFNQLNVAKEPGFYFGSDIGIAKFGTKAIFEGQARFCQLQYVHFGVGKKIDYKEFKDDGLLSDVYFEAFDFFLSVIGEDEPTSIVSPLVSLFLLICDIAINPVEGFPMDIYHFKSFVISSDPGIRFGLLCHSVKNNFPEMKNGIIKCSKEEYIEFSNKLSISISSLPPMTGLEMIKKWMDNEKSIIELLNEEADFKYSPENTAIRVLFSKYLRFQQDKIQNPQFFVWPGVCMSNREETGVTIEEAGKLFDKHRALFMDAADGEIYPIEIENVLENNVQETFDQFYQWNSYYDMVKQWIIQEGAFTYNYDWLTKKFMPEDTKLWADGIFKHFFGVNPDEVQKV